MRATWPGARSGRIRMVTGPLEVSRSKVLSRSASGFWVIGAFGFPSSTRLRTLSRFRVIGAVGGGIVGGGIAGGFGVAAAGGLLLRAGFDDRDHEGAARDGAAKSGSDGWRRA